MKIFIGILIGIIIGVFAGIFCMSLTLSFSYYDAYMYGVNSFKKYIIAHLTKIQEDTDTITCTQLIDEINKV